MPLRFWMFRKWCFFEHSWISARMHSGCEHRISGSPWVRACDVHILFLCKSHTYTQHTRGVVCSARNDSIQATGKQRNSSTRQKRKCTPTPTIMGAYRVHRLSRSKVKQLHASAQCAEGAASFSELIMERQKCSRSHSSYFWSFERPGRLLQLSTQICLSLVKMQACFACTLFTHCVAHSGYSVLET